MPTVWSYGSDEYESFEKAGKDRMGRAGFWPEMSEKRSTENETHSNHEIPANHSLFRPSLTCTSFFSCSAVLGMHVLNPSEGIVPNTFLIQYEQHAQKCHSQYPWTWRILWCS